MGRFASCLVISCDTSLAAEYDKTVMWSFPTDMKLEEMSELTASML